jgi:signal transduction histidine kinase
MSPPQPEPCLQCPSTPGLRRGCLAILLSLCSAATARAADATATASHSVPETSTTNNAVLLAEATNYLGQWIWDTNTLDKQTCRFWKSFEIPHGVKISTAILRITVDNGYTLFLDGREIGRGSDWRTVTEYDLTELLNPGRHVVAVEAFNDRLQGGLTFGLHIQLVNEEHSAIDVVSDDTWRVVPNALRHWADRRSAAPDWHHAIVVGSLGQPPWDKWPIGVTLVPPLRPVLLHFWQTGWFQLTLLAVCGLAVLFCFWLMTQLAAQSKAQRFLQVERARIARDIHDDLGAQLTQLVLLGEVAQSEQTDEGTRAQFDQMCEQARGLSHAMGEVVWAVNSQRDTVRDFVSYVCKYAQVFLAATPIRCRLDVQPEIPAIPFDLPVRRNLFLAVKEALNNAARHSGADELFLRIYRGGEKLAVTVEDNGRGFDPSQPGAGLVAPEQSGGGGNGLANMLQRMNEIGGTCSVVSEPGGGCAVRFTVPLAHARRRWRRRETETAETAK